MRSMGCVGGGKCVTHELWAALGRQIYGFLASITLARCGRKAQFGPCGKRSPRQESSSQPDDQRIMTTSRTYLDHNATSPLRPEARDAMLAVLENPGNAVIGPW